MQGILADLPIDGSLAGEAADRYCFLRPYSI